MKKRTQVKKELASEREKMEEAQVGVVVIFVLVLILLLIGESSIKTILYQPIWNLCPLIEN